MKIRIRIEITAILLTAILMLVSMGGMAYADTDISGETWDQLQKQINETQEPETFNIASGAKMTGSKPLTIPSGKDITLNLDGVTLSRDLSSAAANGNVITVEAGGKLTINGGTVTGGKSSSGGGGIVNSGTLVINNTVIKSNTAYEAGGLFNKSGGNATISGAEITGNTGTGAGGGGIVNYGTINVKDSLTVTGNTTKVNGGGVWNGGTFAIEGKVIIKDNNSTDTDKKNLYLKAGKVINISGPVSGDSKIMVSGDDMPRLITSGWKKNNPDGSTDTIAYDIGKKAALFGDEIAADFTYLSRYPGEKNHVHEPEELPRALNATPKTGWYCSWGPWQAYGSRITIKSGQYVRIILLDGDTLQLQQGINVEPGAALYIYGQEGDSGRIIATAGKYNAAIGANDEKDLGEIEIHGGTINATGGAYGAGIGTGDQYRFFSDGCISIYGGVVRANGGTDAAGIGGGNESCGTHIRIFGGDVSAQGGNHGSGIGGGDEFGPQEIEIHGGDIVANGGQFGAGIGEGDDGDDNYASGTINISGGNITARGGRKGAGIGGGCESNTCLTINISGGNVEAYGDATGDDAGIYGGAGIGAGVFGHLFFGGNFEGDINISGGKVKAVGSGCELIYNNEFIVYNAGAGIGSGDCGDMAGTITISGGEVEAIGRHGGAAIGAGSGSNSQYGNCRGTINIKGGTVKLDIHELHDNNFEGEGKVSYIGHGAKGSNEGTLKIGSGLKVWQNGKDPVDADKRDETCRLKNEKPVLNISACDHAPDGISYKDITPDTHTAVCRFCRLDEPEAHTWDGSGKCSVCGYTAEETNKKTIKFSAGEEEVKGNMADEEAALGTSYELPECRYEPLNESITFKEWSVSIGSTEAVSKNPHDTIIVTADTVVTAQWAYKGREDRPKAVFKADGPDGGNLTGLLAGKSYAYSIGDDKNYKEFSAGESGSFAIGGLKVDPDEEIDLYLIKKGIKEEDAITEDSNAQIIIITRAETPTTPQAVNCSDRGDDGKITGVRFGMEYRREGAAGWTRVFGSEVDHLSAGTYYVRTAADGTVLASESVELKIAGGGTAMEKEETPEADFAGEDMDIGTLSGLEEGSYVVTGAASAEFTSDGSTPVTLENVSRGTLYVTKKGNGTTTADSDPQKIEITRSEKPEVSAEGCSTEDNNDGSIRGVSDGMEYRLITASSWSDCSGDHITDLEPGIYVVRVKPSAARLASKEVIVRVDAYTPESQVRAPVLEPDAGEYTESVNITISCPDEDALIYYTTDGSTPSEDSELYTGPITVSSTTTISAIALMDGKDPSDMVEAGYTIVPAKYLVTVENGSADISEAARGSTVTVTANEPPEGKVFDRWTSGDSVSFADETSETTTFTMPAGDVEVKAVYKDKPAPDPETARYIVAAGEGLAWTRGSGDPAEFTFRRTEDDAKTFGNFRGIRIDDTDIDKSQYEAEQGSVKIKLKPQLLESLAAGNHRLTAVFTDGTADAHFSVTDKSAGGSDGSGSESTGDGSSGKSTSDSEQDSGSRNGGVKTGDETNLALWIMLAGLAAAELAVMTAARMRRKK